MGNGGKEVLLMDGSGKTLLTMRRRQKLSLVANWHVYEGDVHDDNHCRLQNLPICKVRRHMNPLHTNQNVIAHVFLYAAGNKRYVYVIEGSYRKRSCKVLDESRMVLAEIRRKEEMIKGISFGVEVFLLIVRSGFDHGIAMAIVLLLDQMFS
ncbi:LURP1-like domain [Macleaya cordata]|uniref:LURP1-like domain n=1 Tax=Macleaya cordata TaxID=56857 RepID=A0A200R857_MACCD|nr:LURP1-like domain [Macleaya cordata]